MRVLLTNDDGIDAPGLSTLVFGVKENGWDPVVVAPSSAMSGASRSFQSNILLGLRERNLGFDCPTFSVDSTPAACVLAALGKRVGGGFDLCLSGINNGENLGAGLTISGTFGAAVEASVNGVRAASLSMEYGQPAQSPDKWAWQDTRTQIGRILYEICDDFPRFGSRLANVNICWTGLADQLRPVNVSRQSYFVDRYDDREDCIRSRTGFDPRALEIDDDIRWFVDERRNIISFFASDPMTPIRI